VRLGKDALVATTLRGLARQAACRPIAQARALDAEAVATIRGSLKTDAAPRAVRDLALISLLACTGLRRSEAARLRWADVQAAEDGSGRLTVRRSKTDPTGDGAVIAVTGTAMTDLARWQAGAGADPHKR